MFPRHNNLLHKLKLKIQYILVRNEILQKKMQQFLAHFHHFLHKTKIWPVYLTTYILISLKGKCDIKSKKLSVSQSNLICIYKKN